MAGLSSEMNGVRKDSGLSPQDLENTSEYILSKTSYRPKVAIICGSGLGGLADKLEEPDKFAYKDLPNFPVSTVPGHAGQLVFGKLGGNSVVCMQGRAHAYEGYPTWKITLPVRIFKLMGIEVLIVTNAAGALNPEYNVGDIMVLKDHLDLPGMAGLNPLVGQNNDSFGPRFPAMSCAYDKELRSMFHSAVKQLVQDEYIREGTYVMQVGPSFETVTECRMLRLFGADVAGMSTIPEVNVARQCDMRVFAMSLVTNKCLMEYDSEEIVNHEEVLEVSRRRGRDVEALVSRLIQQIYNS